MAENFTIFKYEITPEKEQIIKMPQSAQVLDVQIQPQTDGSVALVMWALVLSSQTPVDRRLVLIDTGEEIPAEIIETFNHVQTVQTIEPFDIDDRLVPKSVVFHLFLERSVIN